MQIGAVVRGNRTWMQVYEVAWLMAIGRRGYTVLRPWGYEIHTGERLIKVPR